MLKHFIGFTLLLGIVALFAVGCSAASPTAAPTITLATTAPTPAPVEAATNPPAVPTTAPSAVPATDQPAAPTDAPATSGAQSPTQAPTAGNAAQAGALPGSLKDAVPGQTYTFKVDPSQTTVAYAVDEVLFGNKQITRGSTSKVDGEFVLSFKDNAPVIESSNLTVDLSTLKSDNSMRDRAIQFQWLESGKYPNAVFVAKSVDGFPAEAVSGQSYTFKVTGDMTIRDITKPVTFDVTITLNGDTLTGEGITQIFMKDFGFEPPEILGRFTVSDPATITIKGTANLVKS